MFPATALILLLFVLFFNVGANSVRPHVRTTAGFFLPFENFNGILMAF